MKKALFLVLANFVWLSACGQKGPLYLPADESAPASADHGQNREDGSEDNGAE